MNKQWQKATKWESNWWGDCCNTFSEETKQLTYARLMGLTPQMVYGHYPVYDMSGKIILDIGGGPVSILLKCINFADANVIDPCDYPSWTKDRYGAKGIWSLKIKGENFEAIDKFLHANSKTPIVDEVWIYNVLQHTDDPALIIQNARKVSKIIRIFEWIETGTNEGHIHNLTRENLDKWLGGVGQVVELNENYCHGLAYYGIFKGDHYEKI